MGGEDGVGVGVWGNFTLLQAYLRSADGVKCSHSNNGTLACLTSGWDRIRVHCR